MGILAAEHIKLTSVRSPKWCAALYIVVGLGASAAIGFAAKATVGSENPEELYVPTTGDAVLGIQLFAPVILMVLAALSVTGEYRTGLIRTTFQAAPDRAKVMFAKAAVVGTFAAIITAFLGFGAFFLCKAVAGNDAGRELSLAGNENLMQIYLLPIIAIYSVVLAIGVAGLLRNSAAAISLLLMWPLLIEPLLGAVPVVGTKLLPFLPFENLMRTDGVDYHWGLWMGVAYFTMFVMVIFGAGVYAVTKRDA